MAARFVSAQLEIESPRPLGHVFEAFSRTEYVAFDYRESLRGFSVGFEYSAAAASSTDPDAQISFFCDTLEALRGRARSIWEGAYRKTFNLGYELDQTEGCFRSELKPETVGRIAQLGASVLVSIYPASPPDPDDEPS